MINVMNTYSAQTPVWTWGEPTFTHPLKINIQRHKQTKQEDKGTLAKEKRSLKDSIFWIF